MDRMRNQGRFVAVAAGVGAVLVLSSVLVEAISFGNSGVPDASWMIHRLPILPYLVALAAMLRAGLQVARGDTFGRIMPPTLRASGVALALAAVMQIFAVPLLSRPEAGPGSGTIAHYDPAYLAVGAVGVLVWMLGGMMQQALAMARELEEFF